MTTLAERERAKIVRLYEDITEASSVMDWFARCLAFDFLPPDKRADNDRQPSQADRSSAET